MTSIAEKLTAIAENEQKVYNAGYNKGLSEGGGGGSGPEYTGTYTVTPTTSSQTLNTANRLLKDDVKIEAIPYSAVSNNTGGTTIIIG